MRGKKLLVVIAHQNYQPVEFETPKRLLEQAGYVITTASNQAGTAQAIDKSSTEVDITVENAQIGDYEGLILIGGSGTLEHLDNEKTYHVIQKAYKQHKVIGAICLATRLLAKAGILEGKTATGWDGDHKLSELYKEHFVTYINQDVVVDNNIITANGPSAAQEFGQTIISILQSQSSWG